MSEEMCPFVGVEHDRETALGFPSPRNMCHRVSPPRPINVVHQGKFCMLKNHTACPVFNQIANASVPPPAAHGAGELAAVKGSTARHMEAGYPPLDRPKRRAREIVLPVMAVAGILAIFLAVMLILPPTPSVGPAPLSTTTTALAQPPTATRDLRSIVLGNTSALTPTPKASPSAPPTSTAPTPSATKAPFTATAVVMPATQCGRPAGWVVYVVRAGDTMSNLSRIFGVSIAQLQNANCMGSSTAIYAGQVIYTPWVPPTPFFPTAIPSDTETAIPPTQVSPSDTPVPPTEIPSTDTQVPPTEENPTVAATAPPTAAVSPEPPTEIPPTDPSPVVTP